MNELAERQAKLIPPTEPLRKSDSGVEVSAEDDEIFEVDNSFRIGEFQVARREFFAHLRDPSITFNRYRFYPNVACINKFPNTDNVLVLVNKTKKILALMPCAPDTRDAYNWCSYSKGKRKPKQITCKLFSAMVFSMMDWSHQHRYKILGKIIHTNGEYLIAFDLTAKEVYLRTGAEGEESKVSKVPVYNEEWQGQFGLPYEEHQKAMQINVLDGYAVYSLADLQGGNSGETGMDHGFERPVL